MNFFDSETFTTPITIQETHQTYNPKTIQPNFYDNFQNPDQESIFQSNYVQPNLIEKQSDIDLKIRNQQDQLNNKLRLKYQQESNLKSKRKEAGKLQLNNFFAQRQKQINLTRQSRRQLQNINSKKLKDYKSPWQKIVDNIELKEGDYPGKKDVTRMKQAILNKKEDDLRRIN